MTPINDEGIWFFVFLGVGLVWWIFQKGRDLATKPARDAAAKVEADRMAKEGLEMAERHIADHKRRLVTCRCGEAYYHPEPPTSWSMQHQKALVEQFSREHVGYGHQVTTNYREFVIDAPH